MVVLGWDELGLSYKSCRTSLSQILFWAQLYNVVFNNPYMPSPAQQVNNKTARRSLCCLLGSWNPFENWSEWVSEWDQVKNTLLSLRFPLSLSLSLSQNKKKRNYDFAYGARRRYGAHHVHWSCIFRLRKLTSSSLSFNFSNW